MERAPAPGRSAASVTINFGLMSIPCSLYAGTQDTAVRQKEYVQSGDGKFHPVGRKKINKDTGELILDEGDVVRLLDTEHGPVEVTPDEIAALSEAVPGSADVVCFLPLAYMSAGYYVPEQMYQIKPKREGSGKNKVEVSAKPFDLLMAAMRKRGVFAIAKVVIRKGTQPRYAALMPNERLYLVHFDNEVREDLKRTPAEPSPEQLERASKAIAEATESSPPPLIDEVSERIRAFAAEKAESGEAPEVATVEAKTETVDDLDTLLDAMGV